MDKNIIAIRFKNKIYSIDKEKLIYFLTKLTNTKVCNFSDKDINELLESYGLNDEIFLKNLSV